MEAKSCVFSDLIVNEKFRNQNIGNVLIEYIESIGGTYLKGLITTPIINQILGMFGW